MPQIPPLVKLVANYPGPGGGSVEAVAKIVGGTVESNLMDPKYTAYKDTCAIRVSRSLNHGGDPIPAGGGGIANPYMKHKKVRTDKGGDGKHYIYSTYDMRAYLTGRYGQPKRLAGTASKADLAGIQGIIGFGFWHVDVWDGSNCVGHDGGFGNPKVHEILVWKAP